MNEVSEGRKRLIRDYGPEIIVKCCREWKTHWGTGTWGRCGICQQVPTLVKGKKWYD